MQNIRKSWRVVILCRKRGFWSRVEEGDKQRLGCF